MSAPAERLERLEERGARQTALLDTVVSYLAADLDTARLEGARLDANTRELAELAARVAELERVGDSLEQPAIAAGRAPAALELGDAADPLEAEHAAHVAELLAGGYVVVGIGESPYVILGRFVRTEGKTVFYRDADGRPLRALADMVAIATAAEADAIVKRRAEQ